MARTCLGIDFARRDDYVAIVEAGRDGIVYTIANGNGYSVTDAPTLSSDRLLTADARSLSMPEHEYIHDDYNLEPEPNYGHMMTVAAFRAACRHGGFIDYDGFGHPAKNGAINDQITIVPSRISEIPPEATHIWWLNR